jgi:multidrug efflux pump
MKILNWSLENPVFVNMIMILIVVVGLLTLRMLPRELNPEISLNWVNITTIYPGASAEEVENLITKKIEDEIADIEFIESITSWSGEGFSRISVKFEDIPDDDFLRYYQEMTSDVGKVRIPDEAEEPEFFKWSSSTFLPVLNVAVFGDVDEKELKKIAKDLRNDISDVSGVSKINTAGERDREVWVEIIPEMMKSLNVSYDELQNAILLNNSSLSSGSVKYGKREVILRSVGEYKSVEDVKNVLIRSSENGRTRVGDIANVFETFKRAQTKSRFNGKKSITLSVYKKPGIGTLEVISKLNEVMDNYNKKLPETIRIGAVTDTSYMIDEGIGILSSNALAGVVLVLFILHFFLGTRNAIFAAIGIPTSFLITFIFLYVTDQGMNLSAMFGMVLVLGMIVDDAMVIIENVYRYIEKGYKPKDAVLKGVPEVAVPVMASILTTVAAFLPLMLMPGIMGKFMRVIPIVVCLALAASVIEAFLIMPVHIAKFGNKNKIKPKGDKYVLKVRDYYDRLLTNVIAGRYFLIIGILLAFLIGIGLIAEGAEPVIITVMLIILLITLAVTAIKGSFKPRFFMPLVILFLLGSVLISIYKVKVEMFAEEPLNMVFIRVKAPQGTNLQEMEEILKRYEEIANSMPKNEIKGIVTNVGLLNLDTEVLNGTNVGELIVDIIPKKQRILTEGEELRPVEAILADLQERCKNVTGVEWVGILFPNNGPPTGKPVEVKILGKEFHVLEEIRDKLKAFIGQQPGVFNIDDDFVEGKAEYRFYSNQLAVKDYGLSNIEINNSLQKVISGQPVGIMRDADEELDVMLKYPEDMIESKDEIRSIRIADRMGNMIPITNLGTFKEERSIDVIRRFRRNRSITISGDINTELTTSPEVNKRIQEYFQQIEDQYPGYRLSFEGEFKEFENAFSSLLTLFSIGIGLIFVILGSQFKSWLKPLMIMLTIPMAFVGAIFGLGVSGNPFSIGSMFGMVALAGVVVNSAIVLVDFINVERKKGMGIVEAVIHASHVRFRPIVLTSVTTVFGMLPLAIGIGGKSLSWQPLAITIVFGLLIATLLTLLVIPSMYLILEDFIIFYRKNKIFRNLYRGSLSLIAVLILGAMSFQGDLVLGLVLFFVVLTVAFLVDLEIHDTEHEIENIVPENFEKSEYRAGELS